MMNILDISNQSCSLSSMQVNMKHLFKTKKVSIKDITPNTRHVYDVLIFFGSYWELFGKKNDPTKPVPLAGQPHNYIGQRFRVGEYKSIPVPKHSR